MKSSGVIFAGLSSDPLGKAQIAQSDGNLLVSNIESARDGIGVNLGKSEGLHWLLHLPQLPVGAYAVSRSIGQVSGKEDRLISESRIDFTDSGYTLTPNYEPIGGNTFRVRLFLDGRQVHEQPGIEGSIAFTAQRAVSEVECCNHDPHGWSYRGKAGLYGVGKEILFADAILVQAEDIHEEIGYISRLEEGVSGASRMTIRDMFLMGFAPSSSATGHLHHALGNATLQASPGKITVSKIGSSGADGVSIDFGGELGVPRSTTAAEVTIDPLDMREKGFEFRVEAIGIFKSTYGRSLGAVRFRNNGNGLELDVDFRSRGASSLQVSVFDEEIISGTSRCEAHGVVATLSEQVPRIVSFGITNELPQFPRSMFVAWDDRAAIAVGGNVLTGNRMVLSIADNGGDLDNLLRFDITTAGLAEFAILAEKRFR